MRTERDEELLTLDCGDAACLNYAQWHTDHMVAREPGSIWAAHLLERACESETNEFQQIGDDGWPRWRP